MSVSALGLGEIAEVNEENDGSSKVSSVETTSDEFKTISSTIMDTYLEEGESDNSFFSLASRMRYVKRWSLYKNSEDENLEEHSFEVAVIAHALAVIKNKKFGGEVDENKVAVFGMFHDILEVVTGDAPTPTKHFDPNMKKMYTKLEDKVSEEMLSKIKDEDIRESYRDLILPGDGEEEKEIKEIVKAADHISALIKCLREKANGNRDFDKVYERLKKKVNSIDRPEVEYFVDKYLKSYGFSKEG